MKISCPCGELISDCSDYLSYKARFVADMDNEDFWQAMDSAFEELAKALGSTAEGAKGTQAVVEKAQMQVLYGTGRYQRDMYLCTSCGRLLIEDVRGNIQIFEPQDGVASKNLLCSIEGDTWTGFLRGLWRFDLIGGELRWGTGKGGEHGFCYFDDFETLSQRYFDIFHRLHGKGFLLSASLIKGEETIHCWEPEKAAGAKGNGIADDDSLPSV